MASSALDLSVKCDHDPTKFKDGVCGEPCGTQLACGDICSGTCADCHLGVHVPCTQPCGKVLICGHICEFPCKSFCPPCPKLCRTNCCHGKCDRICGSPCAPCKEPCGRGCEHFKCSKLCFEPCDHDICENTCSRILLCGHACVGLCGEECPPCRTCYADKFTSVFYPGEELDPKARFVQLTPCYHLIEIVSLKKWLSNRKEVNDKEDVEVVVKKCPNCSSVIENCQQFNEIRSTMQTINQIKTKDFGTVDEATELQKKMYSELCSPPFCIPHPKADSAEDAISSIVAQLKATVDITTQNSLGKPKIACLRMKFQWIKNVKTVIDIYWHHFDKISKDEYSKKIMNLYNNMCAFEYFQKQQCIDFDNEFKRLGCALQLTHISLTGEFLSNRGKANVKRLFEEAEALKRVKYFAMANFTLVIEKLEKELKVVCELTAEEKMMIHRAMCPSFNGRERAQGHWFKCSGGHIYCITECGGADQLGHCPDCREPIGGVKHVYVETATVATEMDGARHAAWSAQNNLNDYDLNDL